MILKVWHRFECSSILRITTTKPMPPYHHALVAWAMQIYRFDRVGTVPAVYGPHVVWCMLVNWATLRSFKGRTGRIFGPQRGRFLPSECVRFRPPSHTGAMLRSLRRNMVPEEVIQWTKWQGVFAIRFG